MQLPVRLKIAISASEAHSSASSVAATGAVKTLEQVSADKTVNARASANHESNYAHLRVAQKPGRNYIDQQRRNHSIVVTTVPHKPH